MNSRSLYQRELEVRYQTDVLVVGGGPAGVAAALAAARQGKSVRLIEAHSCLGGMGTAGMVPAFMQFTDGVNFLADGIGREILDALTAAGGATPWRRSTGIRTEVLKRVYDQLLRDAGVPFTFHTQLVDVAVDGERVREAICAGRSGLFAMRATVFVDCTGDGDLSAFAGAPYEKGDADGTMQPGTLCSVWAGIDWETVEDLYYWGGTASDGIEKAIEDGVFTVEDHALVGFWRVGATLGGGNIGHTFDLDGTDEESLTRAYVRGRQSMPEYERFYKEYLQGYEEMELVATASLMGVRESRRIMGDYVLNLDDYLRRAVFDDEIGRHAYNIDLHPSKADVEIAVAARKDFDTLRLKDGESYGIPYRVLTPRGLKNVLVAGRCVSTDRKVQGAIRVMPGCYITGQAAGVAAAMAVQAEADTRAIDVRDLQARLKALGAYLPNFAGL
jgi:hypothetical protein